jgi:hypothetical protein
MRDDGLVKRTSKRRRYECSTCSRNWSRQFSRIATVKPKLRDSIRDRVLHERIAVACSGHHRPLSLPFGGREPRYRERQPETSSCPSCDLTRTTDRDLGGDLAPASLAPSTERPSYGPLSRSPPLQGRLRGSNSPNGYQRCVAASNSGTQGSSARFRAMEPRERR